MIQSVIVTNHLGESLTITLSEAMPSHGLLITEIEGIGPVKATINKTDLATADGAIFNSARLGTRTIDITLRLVEAASIEDSRQRCYQYFPNKKEIKLTFNTDNRNVYCTGIVENVEPDIFSKEETLKITINCADPNFYSIVESKMTFSDILGLFYFPFSNEIPAPEPEPDEPDIPGAPMDAFTYRVENGYFVIYDINVDYMIDAGMSTVMIPDVVENLPVKFN